jgi:hypothetical protein
VGAELTSEDPLAQPVYASDGYKPLRDFTLSDVQARAAELKAATGWGPTARVGAVARAWSQLAREMTSAGVGTISELGVQDGEALARRLWVTPPGGSLL